MTNNPNSKVSSGNNPWSAYSSLNPKDNTEAYQLGQEPKRAVRELPPSSDVFGGIVEVVSATFIPFYQVANKKGAEQYFKADASRSVSPADVSQPPPAVDPLVEKKMTELDSLIRNGNESTVIWAMAERAFIDGDFDSALAGYYYIGNNLQDPESNKLSEEDRNQALHEVNTKIIMILRVKAAKETQEGNFDAAKNDLEEALSLSPSTGKKMIVDQMIQVLVVSGEGDLEAKRIKIGDEHSKWMAFQKSKFQSRHRFIDRSSCVVPPGAEVGCHGDRNDFDPDYYDNVSFDRRSLEFKSPYLDRASLLEGDYKKAKERIADLVRHHLNPDAEGIDKIDREMYLASVFVSLGDSQEAINVYKQIRTESQNSRDPQIVLKRAQVGNELGAIYLGQNFQLPQAIIVLDAANQELETLPRDAAGIFLQTQNRFLKAEVLLADADTEKEVNAGIRELESIHSKEFNGEDLWEYSGTPEGKAIEALYTRVTFRLAQMYFSRPETVGTAIRYADAIILNSHNNSDFVPDALALKGLGLIRKDKAVEGLETLRELQLKYPDSEAAKAISSNKRFKGVVDERGVIRDKINKKDIGEALKVLVDRSGNTPLWRKGFFAGAGILVGLVFAPEFTIPVLMAGAGGGLLADRLLGAVEHWGDVTDAYRTGLSNVDMVRNLTNIFMLGLDVGMLFTAGTVGSLAREGTKTLLKKWGIGEFTTWATSRLVGHGVTYTAIEGLHAVTSGEFHWSPKRALMLTVMSEVYAFAEWTGAGAAVSRGAQSVGFTKRAGDLSGWVTNTAIGATVYYPIALGSASLGWETVPGFDDFLIEQFKTMGPLHAAGVALKRVLPKMGRSASETNLSFKEFMKRVFSPHLDIFGRPRDPLRFQRGSLSIYYKAGLEGGRIFTSEGTGKRAKNLVEIPKDARKVTIRDGERGTIDFDFQDSAGLYLVTNNSDRPVYFRVGAEDTPKKILSKGSGLVPDYGRIRIGDGWYDLRTRNRDDAKKIGPPTESYTPDLPPQPGNQSSPSGEIDNEPTVVDSGPKGSDLGGTQVMRKNGSRTPQPRAEANREVIAARQAAADPVFPLDAAPLPERVRTPEQKALAAELDKFRGRYAKEVQSNKKLESLRGKSSAMATDEAVEIDVADPTAFREADRTIHKLLADGLYQVELTRSPNARERTIVASDRTGRRLTIRISEQPESFRGNSAADLKSRAVLEVMEPILTAEESPNFIRSASMSEGVVVAKGPEGRQWVHDKIKEKAGKLGLRFMVSVDGNDRIYRIGSGDKIVTIRVTVVSD